MSDVKTEHVDMLNEMVPFQWYYTLSKWSDEIGYLVDNGFLERQLFNTVGDRGQNRQIPIYRKIKEVGGCYLALKP